VAEAVAQVAVAVRLAVRAPSGPSTAPRPSSEAVRGRLGPGAILVAYSLQPPLLLPESDTAGRSTRAMADIPAKLVRTLPR
jgi:hypothetical protein